MTVLSWRDAGSLGSVVLAFGVGPRALGESEVADAAGRLGTLHGIEPKVPVAGTVGVIIEQDIMHRAC